MKKILFSTFTICAIIAVNTNFIAQDFKQVAGEKNLELQFAPLGGSPLGIGGIRLRSFSSETSAMRLTIFAGYTHDTKVTQTELPKGAGGDSLLMLKDNNSSIEFSIRPGIEKHMAGTDRLSPWMGAEIDFGIKTSTEKKETQKNYSTDPLSIGTKYTKTTKGKDGYMRIGANVVAGCDWYFAKKIYLGVELGLGVAMNNKSKIKCKDEDAAAAAAAMAAATSSANTYKDPVDQKQGGSINFGPVVNSKIRIGYLF